MLRLLITIAIISSFSFANSTEKLLKDFFITTLDRYNIEEFKVNDIKELEYPKGWSAYFVRLKYKVQDRDILIDDIIFSDNISISRDFTDLKSKKSLKAKILEEYQNSTKEK